MISDNGDTKLQGPPFTSTQYLFHVFRPQSCEQSAGVSQGKREEKYRILTHEVRQGVPRLYTDGKAKSASRNFQIMCARHIAVAEGEVGGREKIEGDMSHHQDAGENHIPVRLVSAQDEICLMGHYWVYTYADTQETERKSAKIAQTNPFCEHITSSLQISDHLLSMKNPTALLNWATSSPNACSTPKYGIRIAP